MQAPSVRKLGYCLPVAAFVIAFGCAPEEGAEVDEQVGDPSPGAETEAGDSAAAPLMLSSDVSRLTREVGAIGFPHGPHSGIVCSQCHVSVVGHDSHSAVDCVECHRGSAFLGQRVVFSQGECMACHHAADQTYACASCHETAPSPVTRTQSVHLAVWPAPRTVTLPFDHERHASVDCATCHSGGVLLDVTRDCTSCHEEHHQPELTCSTCHTGAPGTPQAVQEAHEVEAHLGCAGASCHSDPLPRRVALAPSTCLVCHTAQADHEPGGDCANCHQVRPPREGPAVVEEVVR